MADDNDPVMYAVASLADDNDIIKPVSLLSPNAKTHDITICFCGPILIALL